jgi:hypothetical protein
MISQVYLCNGFETIEVNAVNEEDALEYCLELESWKLWNFAKGPITIRKLIDAELLAREERLRYN